MVIVGDEGSPRIADAGTVVVRQRYESTGSMCPAEARKATTAARPRGPRDPASRETV